MLTRRTMTLALTGAAMLPATAFTQADWRAQYPELVIAIVPAENASGLVDRYGPFNAYLSKALGVKVTVLHEGSVLAEGSLDQVQNDQRVVDVYLGR